MVAFISFFFRCTMNQFFYQKYIEPLQYRFFIFLSTQIKYCPTTWSHYFLFLFVFRHSTKFWNSLTQKEWKVSLKHYSFLVSNSCAEHETSCLYSFWYLPLRICRFCSGSRVLRFYWYCEMDCVYCGMLNILFLTCVYWLNAILVWLFFIESQLIL